MTRHTLVKPLVRRPRCRVPNSQVRNLELPPISCVACPLTSILSGADTIRMLVATDNHVGYEERDSIRKDDSWKTFDEIINLARKQDVSDSRASTSLTVPYAARRLT